ncbi:MAG: FMN-binding negative transcriptional regulator [Chitinophagales bacterium]|nr:FMN-binding negative transcriptional regulator [Chitinophagales bacterium]
MYIPKHFKMQDAEKVFQFIEKYNFAILVGVQDGIPIATHLPFVIERRGDDWYLIAHLAQQNNHVNLLDNQMTMVVFSEPHAYISPQLYASPVNVPTWNYIAVHAYGIAQVLTRDSEKRSVLEKTILSFDEKYMEQWRTLPEKYMEGLLKGMLAFEIKIERIDAKEKISQNKSDADRQAVMNSLLHSNESIHRNLGEYMKEKYQK